MEHPTHKHFAHGAAIALMGVIVGVTSTLAVEHLTAGIGATPQGHQGFRPVGQEDESSGRYAVRRRRIRRGEEDAPAYAPSDIEYGEVEAAVRHAQDRESIESTPNNPYVDAEYCTEYDYPERGYCEALARQGIRYRNAVQRRELEDQITQQQRERKQRNSDNNFYEWVRGRRVIREWNGPTRFIRPDRDVPSDEEETHAAPTE